MPLYLFEREDGSHVEAYYTMANAPSIGSVVEIDGESATRLASCHLPQPEAQRKFERYPYESNALPIYTRPNGMELEFGSTGKPIILSKQHESEYAARMNMEKR